MLNNLTNFDPLSLRLTALLFFSLLLLIPFLLFSYLGTRVEVSYCSIIVLFDHTDVSWLFLDIQQSSFSIWSQSDFSEETAHSIKSGKSKISMPVHISMPRDVQSLPSVAMRAYSYCETHRHKILWELNVLHLIGTFHNRDRAITQEGTSQCFALWKYFQLLQETLVHFLTPSFWTFIFSMGLGLLCGWHMDLGFLFFCFKEVVSIKNIFIYFFNIMFLLYRKIPCHSGKTFYMFRIIIIGLFVS